MRIRGTEIKPFISLILIFFSLLTMAFSKTEVRRLGYNVLKLSREYKNRTDQRRLNEMNLARLVRPDRIEDYAHSRLALRRASKGQIVQISGQTIALRH